jgi:hypothetical protein
MEENDIVVLGLLENTLSDFLKGDILDQELVVRNMAIGLGKSAAGGSEAASFLLEIISKSFEDFADDLKDVQDNPKACLESMCKILGSIELLRDIHKSCSQTLTKDDKED